MLILWTIADILIIADESDLNVYKTASKEDIGVGCCSGGKGSSGGCGVKRKVDTKDLDLNEWAGKRQLITPSVMQWLLILRQLLTRYLPLSQINENTMQCQLRSVMKTYTFM